MSENSCPLRLECLRSAADESETPDESEEESESSSEADEGRSSEESAKSVVLSRFLTKLMDPIHPLKYSKSLPSLSLKAMQITDNESLRKDAFMTEGWILERCMEGTPGRKYNMSGLIVDSDAIMASKYQKDRRNDTNEDIDTIKADDSASQSQEPSPPSALYVSLYLIILILAAHGLWSIVCGLAPSWVKHALRHFRR